MIAMSQKNGPELGSRLRKWAMGQGDSQLMLEGPEIGAGSDDS